MVKVLENQIIDLDLLPGKEQQELKAQIQEHIAKTGYAQPAPPPFFFFRYPSILLPKRKNHQAFSLISSYSEQSIDKLPPEQKEQLQQLQKQKQSAADGASNAAVGVANTLGGAVKGVLDTAGNTVIMQFF